MPELINVFVAIGSNEEREASIAFAIRELHSHYSDLVFSSVYESAAVGFTGSDFFNLVCHFTTIQSLEKVHQTLKAIEGALSGNTTSGKSKPRKLDLDLLLYGNEVIDSEQLHIPRKDIEEYPFVLKPLLELAPDLIHPALNVSIASLWKHSNMDKDTVWKIEFNPQEALQGTRTCH